MSSSYRPNLSFPKTQANNIHSSIVFSPHQLSTCRTYSIPNFKEQTQNQCQSQLHPQSSTLTIKSPSPSPSPSPLSSLTGISVVCRFRPINELEKSYNNKLTAKIVSDKQVDIISDSEFYVPSFQFDRIFPMSSTQSDIYTTSSQPIVQSVLDGYNGTILAYGQTASGKTHTMQGLVNSDELKGVIPRAIHQIFSCVSNKLKTNEDCISISLTMIEIYMERVNDLLNIAKQNLNIRESKDKKHYIDDVSEYLIQSESDFLTLFNQGILNRTIGSTQMNYNSSRSHCIVIITVSQKNNRSRITKKGKLYLVDLAGSEKASKTGVTGLNLEEAKNINKSLSTLGLIIKTLTDGTSTHIPYRESKLTRILCESLGGNSKTCLILTCSPSNFNEAETLSTLRFGMRAKRIKNKPIVNKELSLAELKEKVEEMTQLISVKNNRIKELETRIKTSGINADEVIEDDQNEADLKECLRDITIVDKENEKLINDLNEKLKEKDSEYQKEVEILLETIETLKRAISQKETIKDCCSFQNLTIKNVFHSIYNATTNNESENSCSLPIITKEDKSISTEQYNSSNLTLSKGTSFSFCSPKVPGNQIHDVYSYYFILICVCIIFSYAIHFILEYI